MTSRPHGRGTDVVQNPKDGMLAPLTAVVEPGVVSVVNPNDSGGSTGVCGETRMILTLPLPPSTNNLYATVMRRGKPIRVKSREGKAFDAIVAHRVLHWCLTHGSYAAVPSPPYRLDILIFPKDRRRDASNFVKATEDSVFAAINRNDRLVVDVRARLASIDKADPRVVVTLSRAAAARPAGDGGQDG